MEEHKSKKQHAGKAVGKDVKKSTESNSALVDATFAGKITRKLCAESGSNINLLPPDVLADLVSRKADITVTRFAAPKRYELAVSTSD